MHFAGLAGMPRRIQDYSNLFENTNWWSSLGSGISFISLMLFCLILSDAMSSKNDISNAALHVNYKGNEVKNESKESTVVDERKSSGAGGETLD